MRTVNFLKHFIHPQYVVVIQKPRLAVFLVLFEWYTE